MVLMETDTSRESSRTMKSDGEMPDAFPCFNLKRYDDDMMPSQPNKSRERERESCIVDVYEMLLDR